MVECRKCALEKIYLAGVSRRDGLHRRSLGSRYRQGPNSDLCNHLCRMQSIHNRDILIHHACIQGGYSLPIEFDDLSMDLGYTIILCKGQFRVTIIRGRARLADKNLMVHRIIGYPVGAHKVIWVGTLDTGMLS